MRSVYIWILYLSMTVTGLKIYCGSIDSNIRDMPYATCPTCRLNSLGLDASWRILGCCGELPPESCVLEGRGDIDSGEDKLLISSSFDGIVIVRVGVGFFDDTSGSLLFTACIVVSASDIMRISGLLRFTYY